MLAIQRDKFNVCHAEVFNTYTHIHIYTYTRMYNVLVKHNKKLLCLLLFRAAFCPKQLTI